jgi:type I restriction enzyme S subunit
MSFPRYTKYKDIGFEWLREMPEHWKVLKIKRVASIRYGIGEPPSYHEDGTPLIRATNVHAGKIFADGIVFVDPSEIPEQRIVWLTAGDIIVVRSGAYTGDSAIIPIGFGPCIAGFDMVLKCQSALPEFIQCALLSKYLKEGQIDIERMRAAQPHLNAEELGECLVMLPDAREQALIVDALNRETAKIDDLMAEQQRLIELLREKRHAVVSQAVTRGLNPGVATKQSGVGWIGEIPSHWEISRSRRMFAVRSEPAWASDKMLTASQKYGVLYQSDFVETEGRRVVEVIMGVESLKHVEPDDFIISMRSFQGGIEWCRLRGSTSFHYVMLKPIDGVHPPFFAHLFKSLTYIQALRATTDLIRDGQELRFSHFVQVDLPRVPMEEQISIALFLDRETAKLDSLIAEAQRGIELFQERRVALISAAVTGQIDVRGLLESEAA